MVETEEKLKQIRDKIVYFSMTNLPGNLWAAAEKLDFSRQTRYSIENVTQRRS
jgi:hypothetical protein